jgi:hypothetical protein
MLSGELGDIFNIEIRDQYVLATFVYSELVLVTCINLTICIHVSIGWNVKVGAKRIKVWTFINNKM